VRVAMVSEHASPLAVLGGVDAGGQNVHVAALACAIARRGVDVAVHTRRDDPSLDEWVPLAPGVVVHHVDAGPPEPVPKDELLPHMDDFTRELVRVWSEDPPDVVHGHFWMSGLAAVAAGRVVGAPIVQTFHALGAVKRRHQGAADTSPPGRLRLERAVMRQADRIAATCSDEVFELVRLGADRRRISVVPCGVDTETFRPDGPRELAARPRIVCAGRLVPRKGVDDVIRAMAHLPGAELVIAGGPPPERLASDPEARRLGQLAEELGVAGRVDIRGGMSREGVAALLRSADAVTCCPWYEPFGIVPLEAMACGVPVVAASVGGLIDTVVDGETGLHVPPRSPDRIAGALATLLDDGRLRRRLGDEGHRRVTQRFTWDRVAADTLEVYARVRVSAPVAAQIR
jgi:D-inositol-3-phosphate glycosyltransferase